MAEIQLAVEGEGAIAATEALLEIPGITGDYQPILEDTYREGTIAAIATIIGIVGGTLAIAEQIRKWYQEYRADNDGKHIDKVLIITSRGRILLEDATIEEIAKALEPFAQ